MGYHNERENADIAGIAYTTIERAATDPREPLALAEIIALHRRAFGEETRIVGIHELGGGKFNNVYRIERTKAEAVILRVAPPPSAALPWHERDLMRHEHLMQPYFAPIAPLLPRTLMSDFTRQLIPRDYLFQTLMPGVSWSAVASELSQVEEDALWRQLAEIARAIHSVSGERFGLPGASDQFTTWSATIEDWLERSARDIEAAGLSAAETYAIRDAAHGNAALLDEITTPHLLHGDLWTFNLLIERSEGNRKARIVAVLDNDRVSWGDPLADWTFHLLPRHVTPHAQRLFWDTYGHPEETAGLRFRRLIYEGLHASNVLSDVKRRQRDDLLPQVRATVREIAAALR